MNGSLLLTWSQRISLKRFSCSVFDKAMYNFALFLENSKLSKSCLKIPWTKTSILKETRMEDLESRDISKVKIWLQEWNENVILKKTAFNFCHVCTFAECHIVPVFINRCVRVRESGRNAIIF